MKWFDKWFAKKCQQSWESSVNKVEESKYSGTLASPRRGPMIRNEEGLNSRGTNFTMYNANGGTVIELRDYDPLSDRHNSVLYVIPKEADLGQQLGHIVTMEALKR
jgi:hypothetical protein